jgi:hypothetical protein
MNRRAIIGRLAVELLVLLMAFSAVDQLTWPEESTAVAVQDAANKQQMQPSCLVEVRSAIRSAAFVRVALFTIQAAAVGLLGSDLWLLWQSRRRPNPQGGANGRQPFSSETNRVSAAAASRRSP